MPVVEVSIREQSPENKKKIAEGIAQVLVETGVPKHAITILFRTVNPGDVAIGGEMLNEYLARQKQGT